MCQNELYPIFLKVHQLRVLIVGGGNVALEKLTFLLKSSPNAHVYLVSKKFHPEILAISQKFHVTLIHGSHEKRFIRQKQLVIAATDDPSLNRQIYEDAKAMNVLVNVADTPALCDFYMGGIITKGNVKIAISTNGKSPTLAKRLRQFFEEVLPKNIDDLAMNLNDYRHTIKADFQEKVAALNKLTRGLVDINNK